MWTVRWVKDPLDVLLEQAFMNLFLIPSTDGLSELLFTWPFLAINLLRASRKESVSKLWATSICTARMDTHVKITPYRLTRLRARRTWKGPKQSTPTVVKGGWSGVRRSSGGSAIFCSRTGAWRRRQPTHFRQYSSLSRPSIDYPESFAQKTQTVLSTRVTRDEVKVLYQKVGHMIILWTDDLMSTVKRRLGPSKSSTDTQRAVNQYWI